MTTSRVYVASFGIALCFLLAGVSIADEIVEADSAEASAPEQPYLASQLEPFRPLLGKTYRGTFASSTPEMPITDVQRWERALNGRAIRLVHSVNEGAYGGETFYMWNEAKEEIVFYYFTTLGFVTEGTIRFDDRAWTSKEVVQAGSTVTEIKQVEATGTFLSDGRVRVEGRFLEGDEWREADSVTYEEAPEAVVAFR